MVQGETKVSIGFYMEVLPNSAGCHIAGFPAFWDSQKPIFILRRNEVADGWYWIRLRLSTHLFIRPSISLKFSLVLYFILPLYGVGIISNCLVCTPSHLILTSFVKVSFMCMQFFYKDFRSETL